MMVQTKKWYIINDHYQWYIINGQYGKGNQNDSTIKFNTEIVKSFLVDCSDAYNLVTGDIAVVSGNTKTNVAFKYCHPFTRAVIHLNDEHVDTAENLDLTINLYNLIEYSNNYADTTASLYQYKRPERRKLDNGNLDNVTIDDSSSFQISVKFVERITYKRCRC